ncbi:MAG: response regulator [Anaerolineae bacterium]
MAVERVLIIDDSRRNIKFLSEHVLGPAGFRVLTAHDGEAGLAISREQQPDLILLEMDLPKMAGAETLRALGSGQPQIPVIAMTSHSSESQAVQAFRLGAKDYLARPFEAAEMLGSVERALAEPRLRRERDELADQLLAANQALERRTKELHTLFGIGKSVTAVFNDSKMQSRLVEAALYLTGAETGSLLLLDEGGSRLVMVAACGIDDRVARAYRLPVDGSLAGEVVTGGQPLLLTGREAAGAPTPEPVRSLMIVPLKVKGRVSGVLTVDNRLEPRDFTNHDLRLLSALADYAAISLDNSRLLRRAEREQAKLSAILAEINDPVLVSGQSGEIVAANAAFGALLGLKPGEDISGQPLHELVLHPALHAFVSLGARPTETHRDEVLLEDGRTFYATLTPVPGVGQAVVMKDVTPLKELGRQKTDFVSTVSHDLRAPLNAIRDYAGMLAQVGPVNPKQSMFVERISGGVNDLLALLDNLLDLSAIELGVDSSPVTVDLAELTHVLVGEFQQQAARNRQHLVYHPPVEPALVQGNPIRLTQLLGNLLENALTNTPPAGQIAVLVQPGAGEVTVKVEDNGIGIPPADLPFVFDKFYRVKAGRQGDAGSGSGLGLAVCKSVVERHNGHIWAESRPGGGSTFFFTLPASPAKNGINPTPVGSPLSLP